MGSQPNKETGSCADGFVIAHVNGDVVVCREREGDYHWDSARSYASVFPTRETAEAFALTHVRSLTVVEPA
jgi:hypothetical protein